MRFTQCPYCGELFSKSTWRKTQQGEYECFRCGNCFDVDAIENEGSAKHQETEELAKIPNLLNNLDFHEAETRLEELAEKYPNNPKVYFLKVLAANCITYIRDESNEETERWIPTLNNINDEPLSSLSAYKRCLDLAEGEEKEHYKQTFDFIEKKRNEVLDDYKTGRYTYDVFISTKVSKLDFSNPANPVPVLDSVGDPIQTEDAKLASQIYDQLRHDNPRLRVFYSEREKDQMVGERFENVIFSALHSAKVFILVASDPNHINWRWVKNEWKRYLYLMDPSEEGYKNRHIILAGKSLATAELPFELKKREFIDFSTNPVASGIRLFNFVNTSLESGENYSRLVAKSFDSSVASINRSALEAEGLQSTTLGSNVQKVDADIEKKATYFIKKTKDTDRGARSEAFQTLKTFSKQHPEVYSAKIQLLLEKTDFLDINDYFSSLENIASEPEVAKQFLTLAEKNDAVERLEKVAKEITEALIDKDLAGDEEVCSVFENFLQQNISYLKKATESALFKAFDERISKLPSNYGNARLVEDYFYLHLYHTNKDPEKYIEKRESLLYRFSNQKILDLLSESILRVDEGNVNVNWIQIVTKINGKVMDIDGFLKLGRDAIAKGTAASFFGGEAVVGNKMLLDRFGKLFLYAPKESKGKYLYAFLLTLTQQKETYTFQGGESQDDANLSGFDLFKKYIGFDMSVVTPYTPKQKTLREYYTSLQEDAFALKSKDKIIPLDELLCYFGVKLHKNGQFNLARDVYNLYLAQQSKITYLDTIMIRYYQTLADSNCIDPEEIIYSSQKFDCDPIGIDLVDYEGEEYDDFSTYMTHKERDRAKYQATYDEVKRIYTLRPGATFSALSKLEQAQKEIDKKFVEIKTAGVSQELIDTLKKDLNSELSTLDKEIKGLKNAKKNAQAIAGSKSPSEVAGRLYDSAGGSVSDKRDQANKKVDQYVKIYEQWGDAAEFDAAKRFASEVKVEINKIASGEDRAQKAQSKQRAAVARAAHRREKAAEFGEAAVTGARVFLRILLALVIVGLVGASLYFQYSSGYISALFAPLINGELFQIDSSASAVLTGLWDAFQVPTFLLALAMALVGGWLIFWFTRICGITPINIIMKVVGFLSMAPSIAYGVILVIDGVYTAIILGLLNCLTCACFGDMCTTCESACDICMNCGSCSDCAGCDQMGAATHALGQGLLTMLQGLLLVIISGVATSGSTVSFIVNRD